MHVHAHMRCSTKVPIHPNSPERRFAHACICRRRCSISLSTLPSPTQTIFISSVLLAIINIDANTMAFVIALIVKTVASLYSVVQILWARSPIILSLVCSITLSSPSTLLLQAEKKLYQKEKTSASSKLAWLRKLHEKKRDEGPAMPNIAIISIGTMTTTTTTISTVATTIATISKCFSYTATATTTAIATTLST